MHKTVIKIFFVHKIFYKHVRKSSGNMSVKVVSCVIALALVTLVHGDKHEELLARSYVYVPGIGYYYFGTGRNWTAAETDCMSSKARLAVINSEEERQAIVSFLSSHTQDMYVLAGYTSYREVQYVTAEGIPLKQSAYTNWESGKPSGSTGRCGGINTKTGELTDLDCSKATPYICEHQLWTGYNYVKGIGYYKLHTEGMGWADAYDICESEGAHLLVINSQAEADAIKQIYDEHPELPNTDKDYEAFIGFRAVFEDLDNRANQGTYLTVLGTSVSDLGYVKWHSDEPAVGTFSYCGTLNRDMSLETWPCDFKFAFFCERESQVFNR